MTTQIIEQNELRVYVGTFGKYNRGSLAGKWLNIKDYKNVDEFDKACRQLHSNEYDPEFMFQDWEYIPNKFIGGGWIDPKLFELIHHPNMEHIDINALWDFLDDVDLDKIKKFEKDIIEKIKSDRPEIIDSIQNSGKIDEDTEKLLTQVIEEYKK